MNEAGYAFATHATDDRQRHAHGQAGAFIFREIDPGTYVVEVMGPGANTVIASSPLINVGTGETISSLVRVPFQTSTLAGVLGSSQSAASAITNAAQVVTAAAAASNIGAQTLIGVPATTTTPANGREDRAHQAEPRPNAASAAPPKGAGPSPAPYAPETDVHILDRIAVLYRYRRIAIAVFVLTSAAIMIQGYSNVQYFRAQGRLLIENERASEVPGISPTGEQFYEDPEPYFQTQYKILRGRDLRAGSSEAAHRACSGINGTAKRPDTPLTLSPVCGRV
jgi:hypothetical protein